MLKEIKHRRSCRDFDENLYPSEEEVNKIIEAGLRAPSAKNLQDSIIIQIKDKKVRDELMRLNQSIFVRGEFDPFYGAPIILLVIAKKSQFAQYDGALTMENMMIEATHLGIDSIWIHRAKEELERPEIKEILKDIPLNLDEYEGIGHLAIGYSKSGKYRDIQIKENRTYKI